MADFSKPYNPQEIEEKIYKLWEESGFFNPDNLPVIKLKSLNPPAGGEKLKSFCIIMPPPNANGSLHLGHALVTTYEDILIRYYRMRGYKTLWLPGADHAGFETQVVYEKKLEKEGRSRFNMPREQLWQEIWDFTQANKKNMESQLRKLGASCDWSREKFTLDKDIISKTQDTFIQMHKDGLVYRGNRLVHWCSKHQTGLSDLEINHEEKLDALYYIKYGPLTVATVRPETIFGDTAVAVNPKDKRYKNLIGEEIEVDVVVAKLKLKIIADAGVDQNFGTGAVKITPAHDLNDYEMWQRHNKEIGDEINCPIEVINKYAKMDLLRHFPDSIEAKKYEGLKVLEARKLIVEDLEKRGLIEKIDSTYRHNVVLCYKCKNMIEPRLMSQWFIKIKPLAKPAIEAVKSGKIKIIPERFKKVYFHWMKNIRDWNISRQIVWGIQIPAWFKEKPSLPREFENWKFSNIKINNGQKIAGNNNEYRIILNDNDLKFIKKNFKMKSKDLFFDFYNGKKRLRLDYNGEGGKIRIREKEYILPISGITGRILYSGEIDGYFMSVEERWLENGYCRYESEFEKKIHPYFKNRRNIRGWEIIKEYSQSVNPSQLLNFIGKESPFGENWKQDADVFDTWFSSGQWPFLTLGWPDLKDYKNFYPTNVLGTAWEILFFWVARMIMFGLYKTKKIPFKYVYLNGVIRDKEGQKMSKSKGNVVNPLDIINIYGTDAIRMALIIGNTPGTDLAFSEDKIRGYRNFANKIWQASRFVLINAEIRGKDKIKLTASDKKYLNEFAKIKKEVSKSIESFKFYDAAEKIYHYFWHTFCDKIIEEMKPRLQGENAEDKQASQYVLLEILKGSLKLLHPFMPFITEEIWQNLSLRLGSGQAENKKMLIIEKW
ncbi:class I tRNA ligase family protein [Candidatus Wolfebacteria bacterium]|nr:class I tRNA ligase family protein [Candidatus Wolfebacteria bacterium]